MSPGVTLTSDEFAVGGRQTDARIRGHIRDSVILSRDVGKWVSLAPALLVKVETHIFHNFADLPHVDELAR